jgi:hypothetical protein
MHEGHAARYSKQMGGIAMTRRSISAILTSLLVGLLVVVIAPTVSADGPCLLDNQGNCGAQEALVSVASLGPAAAVQSSNYRFIETNTTWLPGPVTASIAPSTVTDIQYGNNSGTPIAFCMQLATGASACYARDASGIWMQQ